VAVAVVIRCSVSLDGVDLAKHNVTGNRVGSGGWQVYLGDELGAVVYLSADEARQVADAFAALAGKLAALEAGQVPA
jgi:hypothetical protein